MTSTPHTPPSRNPMAKNNPSIENLRSFKGVLGGAPPNKRCLGDQTRCLLVHTRSIPLRGIADVRKNNSSSIPVAASAPGIKLHVPEALRAQDIFAVFPVVGHCLAGLFAAFRLHRDRHFQLLTDGNVVLFHRSSSFPFALRMGIPSRWQRKSLTSFPWGGGRFFTSYPSGIAARMALAASLPGPSLSRWR